MEVQSPSSSNATDKGENQKQAACLNCRRSKTRCLRDAGDIKCKKCAQTQAECIVPEYRVGRKKGIKNKRDGLEKAVYQIEQAIKRSKTGNHHSEGDQDAQHLRSLLSEAQDLLPRQLPNGSDPSFDHQGTPSQGQSLLHQQNQYGSALPGTNLSVLQTSDENFEVDDAENPLQLLARASDLSAPPNQPSYTINHSSLLQTRNPNVAGDPELQAFFGPFRPSLDVGTAIDPIDLGLATEEEANTLFQYFYDNLAHTRWGLDPLLHTPNFVRKQSSFLFTSIMAVSAIFIPTAAALSKRLKSHCKLLARDIIVDRNRSPEIVLAFMVNIPWMAPGKHWADDETCSYMASALTIAMDISLNKLIVPSPSESLAGVHEIRPPSECITARKALDIDGFQDVEPLSEMGRRLLRRRERIWLALVCLARGRSFTVPITPIIEHCDNWHQSSTSDIWDGSLVASTMLRRDLVNLISDVKKTCDSNRTHAVNGSTIAQSLQDMIDSFFNNWYSTWSFATGGMKDNSIPPYVEILVTHGRLSIYSSVINHPTAPVEVKRFFRAAGLSSSLNVMRAAVQGENRLKSMPNNTAIMISFAACFAFYLSTLGSTGNISLAPSIRRLIEESADVLERIGSNPPHRNGTSALYGRHLREVVGSPQTVEPRTVPRQNQQQYSMQQVQAPISNFGSRGDLGLGQIDAEFLQFSAMSDDQITEAINNAGQELETYMPSFQMDDKAGLDWLDWFNMDVNG
ncbi:hypothetical protein N431DRAFT_490528 [Stipitochalara longipes BDJ]|nr:hypothetical protein N431DRAFT_490528 [Stipitochalara longipes BDJ]